MKSKRAPIFYRLEDLRKYIKKAKARRVVLANGCFDVLHVGHVRYLRASKELGDFLAVALNDDRSAGLIKGSGRPVVPEKERAEILACMKMVDAVLIFSTENVVPILEALRPYCHAKGTDYEVDTVPERETSRKLGINIAIVGDPKDHDSSKIIENLKNSGFDYEG